MKKAFILGNPRSGTSLLRIVLNAHPEIVATPESGFVHWWYKKYKDWDSTCSQSRSTVESYVADLLTSKKIETYELNEAKLIQLILKEQPRDYESLSTCVYKSYGLQRGKVPEVIIDKNNYYIHHLEDLNSIWPDAYYIFLLRDGRDVACSYMDIRKLKTDSPYKPKLPSEIDAIAEEWNENNMRIHHFLSTIGEEKGFTIRFEDLVKNVKGTIEPLLNLMELDFSERILNYIEYNDEPAATLDWKKKTLANPDEQNVGKYKEILSDSEIDEFNRIAREGLILGKYIV